MCQARALAQHRRDRRDPQPPRPERYASQALARARDDGVRAVSIGGIGSGAELETVAQERCGMFTASHLGALVRLAQLARALGAELDLEAVPDAVAAALAAPSPGVDVPRRGLDFATRLGTDPDDVAPPVWKTLQL